MKQQQHHKLKHQKQNHTSHKNPRKIGQHVELEENLTNLCKQYTYQELHQRREDFARQQPKQEGFGEEEGRPNEQPKKRAFLSND